MRNPVRTVLELSKARIVLMVLVTAAATFSAAPKNFDVWKLTAMLLGTALLAGGTNAMNEVLEHDLDGRMLRTQRRPIPSGRISLSAARAIAVAAAAAGTVVLAMYVNVLTSAVGALTFLVYNFVYTPLKRVTPACTAVGAVPGAAPALIGWTAATGEIGIGGWVVFSILFFWQLPHFMAISWTHRNDYQRGGFAMLSVRDPDGRSVARDALVYSLLLLAVTCASWLLGVTHPVYGVASSIGGVVVTVLAASFLFVRSAARARRLFVASNVYLLLTMALLAVGCTSESRHAWATQEGSAARRRGEAVPPPAAIAVLGNFQGPESVLYDPQQDVYFVSNINGGELAKDGNGFISRIDAKTLSVNLTWVQSGKNGAYLDGPKGMTIVGDTLFVSDVTAVRRFDRRSGEPKRAVPIPGATFVNDLTNDGRDVYVSDTGLAMGPGLMFLRTGTESIWKISGDHAARVASGNDLKEPNGLLYTGGKLLVASFGTNQLYTLSRDGSRTDVTELPQGELDGVVGLRDGRFLISSWKGDAVYLGVRNGPFKPLLQGVDAPADIGYDTSRDRLLVPHSMTNEVTIHDVRQIFGERR